MGAETGEREGQVLELTGASAVHRRLFAIVSLDELVNPSERG